MSSYSATLEADGLHPKLHVRYSLADAAPSCPLYIHYSLPPSFILDRFQLSQLHQEHRFGHVAADGSQTLWILGERDLEAPVQRAGGAVVVARLERGKGKEREVVLPLHLRYQLPVETREGTSELLSVGVDWPSLFWLCDTPDAGHPACPLSTLANLSDVFPPSTTVHRVPHSTRAPDPACKVTDWPRLAVDVPTGVASDLPFVETVSFIAVWSGMLWILWAAYRSHSRIKREEKESDKTE